MNYTSAKYGKIVESSSAPAVASRPPPTVMSSGQKTIPAEFGQGQGSGGDAEQNRPGNRNAILADDVPPVPVPSL